MNENDSLPQSFPCKECQAGMLRPTYVTYFTWLDEELITVPNFPAWVCDVCGRREYDERAVSWLATLLNPETGRPTRRPPRPQPPMTKRDSSRPLTK